MEVVELKERIAGKEAKLGGDRNRAITLAGGRRRWDPDEIAREAEGSLALQSERYGYGNGTDGRS